MQLSRRSFLAAAAGLTAGAACSSGDGGTTSTTSQADAPVTGQFLPTDLYATRQPQRFAMGVLEKGPENEYEAVLGPPVEVAFRGPDDQRVAKAKATFRDTGGEEGGPHGIYTVEAVFAAPGIWTAEITVAGAGTGSLPFEVGEEPAAPAPGQPAPEAKSPTAADPLGVDPICTADPPCPLHERSLDRLVGAGRPLAVLFATPARCTSRWCGPVLDVLLAERDEFPDVTFVHVEIFKDLESNELVPTFAEWELSNEPWLYAIDGKGEIVGRLGLGFDAAEIRELLAAL